MTKKVLRAAVVAALCSYLAGCSWLGSTFSNEKVQYESSDSRTDLQVPPDIDAIPSNDRYTVPTRPQIVSANAEAAKREIDIQNKGGAGNVLPETHIATVERDGNLRYVHVKLAPDKVWPTLQDFWSGMGLTLKAQDPKAGYMVTEWAENKANLPQDIIRKTIGKVIDMVYDTGERDQYRLSIERNDDGTSDIFISHRQMVEVLKGKDGDTTVWQPGPSDPQLEGLMLTKLAQKIEAEFNPDAKPEEQKQVEALAATKYVPMSSVVKDAKGEAQAVLINEPYDRAWRRVGVALDRAGFDVLDRDRSRGIFEVQYLDPDYEKAMQKKQGWFKNVFSKPNAVDPVHYQIHLSSDGSQTRVTVSGADGKADTTGVATRITTLIGEQTR